MEFSFTNDLENCKVKSLLARHGVSKRLLAKVKFDGGLILVNGIERNAIHRLAVGDVVTVQVPDELPNDSLIPEDFDLQILFEDEHYLLLQKPAGYPTITGIQHPTGSMANFVKGYILRQAYANQQVHIITRLDRNTSGIMFLAKHRYAHALMMQTSYRDQLEKRYFALVKFDRTEQDRQINLSNLTENFVRAEHEILPDVGEINLPIERTSDSIIVREVRPDGKAARTSYQIVQEKNGLALLDIILHTGRTHQIRVHFSHLGYPLVGDDLYGGNHELIDRQALHCHHLQFLHPFTNERIEVELEMPADMKKLLE